MSELSFPEILDAPTAVATVPASLKSTVLSQFTATETSLVALAAKYAHVAYAVQTPKGLTEAKAARHDLRENGRFLVERAEKRIKAEVNDLKKTVADEVERLVAIVRPAEDAIDAQIKAREEQIAAEKAEAERKAAEVARLEAERRQRLEDGIATLAGYVGKAEGKTAAQIAGGLDFVRGIRIDADHWQEYTERAEATLAATLQRLDAMHAAQVQAEKDAAELAALRAERAARLKRERIADLTAGAAKPGDDEDPEAPALAPLLMQDVNRGMSMALASKPDAMQHAREAAAAIQPVASPMPSPEPACIRLGAINAAVGAGFTMTSEFISTVLGVSPDGRDKSAVLYTATSRRAIFAALIKRLQVVA